MGVWTGVHEECELGTAGLVDMGLVLWTKYHSTNDRHMLGYWSSAGKRAINVVVDLATQQIFRRSDRYCL